MKNQIKKILKKIENFKSVNDVIETVDGAVVFPFSGSEKKFSKVMAELNFLGVETRLDSGALVVLDVLEVDSDGITL